MRRKTDRKFFFLVRIKMLHAIVRFKQDKLPRCAYQGERELGQGGNEMNLFFFQMIKRIKIK